MTRISNLEVSNTTHIDKITTLERDNQTIRDELTTAKASIKTLETQVKNLINSTIKSSAIIDELQDKNEENDIRSMRNCLIIIGITESKGEVAITLIQHFLKNVMKITTDIPIQAVHRVGDGKNRPLRVVLQNQRDKGIIYKNVSNLKNVTNDRGKKYQIRDQLPVKTAEVNNRHKDLMWQNNKKINTADYLEMSLNKGNLTVCGQKYRKLVVAPTAKEILQAKDEDRNRWSKLKVTPGNVIMRGRCQFHGFSICTAKIDTIRDAYLKLKEKHGDSRHIVLAYRLPGKNYPIMQDYVDDQEHGAGKTLLSMLTTANIYNRAMFVVCYYGGEHLGPARFQAYVEAAQSAITHDPYNPVTRQNQTPWQVATAPQGDTMNTQHVPQVPVQPSSPPAAQLMLNKGEGAEAAIPMQQSEIMPNQHTTTTDTNRGRLPSGPLKHSLYTGGKHRDPAADQWEEYYSKGQFMSNASWDQQMGNVTATATAITTHMQELVK